MNVYCNLPFYRMKINSDGNYHSCCHQKQTYANLIEDDLTLVQAFKNPILKQVQEYVASDKLHPLCDTPRCPFHSVKHELEKYKTQEVEPDPIQPIDFELSLHSTHCNIGGINPTPDTACSMCPRSSETFMSWEPSQDLIMDVVNKIKPYIEKVDKLNIQGIAEPFWKGRVLEILDELDFEQYQDHIGFWSFTNGTVFGDKIQNEFIKRVRWAALGFSIDAATPETYKKIRRLNYFHVIERNIKKFVEKTNQYQEDDRYYHKFTTFNINMLNVHEMEQMVRWSHSLGVDEAEFTLTFAGVPDFKMGVENICNEKNWEIFWQGQQLATQVAKELNFKVNFYVPFHGGYNKKLKKA